MSHSKELENLLIDPVAPAEKPERRRGERSVRFILGPGVGWGGEDTHSLKPTRSGGNGIRETRGRPGLRALRSVTAQTPGGTVGTEASPCSQWR